MTAPAKRVDAGLPLRLSCISGEPDYDPKAIRLSEKIDVLFNGEVLPEVCAYDVEAGKVIVPVYDAGGRRVIDRQGLPASGTRRGVIEVRWVREGGAA